MTDQLITADLIKIAVPGTPIPQGSKTIGYAGRRAFIRDANATKLKGWRDQVAARAADLTLYTARLEGPVKAWIRFTFDRPTSHYGTGRNAHRIRPAALAEHPYPGHSNGDLDKLVRAICDALTTGGVWRDDTQLVDLRTHKFYAGEHELARRNAGVDIILEEAR